MSLLHTPPGIVPSVNENSESEFFGYEDERKSESEDPKLVALYRQCEQVHKKIVRVQNSLSAAEYKVPHAQLKTYRRNLDAAYTEYSGFHSKVMELVPEEELERAETVYTKFEECFNLVFAAVEELIMEHDATPASARMAQPQVVVQQQPLKVPIPTFDGEYSNWPKFKAIFQDLMEKSNDSDAVKLYHLDKALVQSAAGALDAKVITEGNYEQAWNILTDRYENKRVIVESHIRGLLTLQKMSSETHKELRRLLDESTRHVESLKYLKQEFTGISEVMVVYLVTSALDRNTRKAWESHQKRGELPKYEPTITFLKSRCQILENCEASYPTSSQILKQKPQPITAKYPALKVHAASTSSTPKECCEFCQGPHMNFQCNILSSLDFEKRMEKVKASGVCFNCLRKGHSSRDCQSKKTCRKCGKRHHTQLHNESTKSFEAASSSAPTPHPEELKEKQEQTTATAWFTHHIQSSKTVFLLTAMVNTVDVRNQLQPCRILLDCGSQVNFVREEFAQRLGLRLQQVTVPIRGINGVKTLARSKVVIQLQSRCTDFKKSIECLVTPTVTGEIPSSNIQVTNWNIPVGVQLADPEFHKPGKIDVLVGAELFFQLMRPGCIKLADDLPELRETKLGWIVSGVLNEPLTNQANLCYSHAASLDNAEESICRFWELEEIPADTNVTTEHEECEAHFRSTYRRNNEGRFVVKLPFRLNKDQLSDNRALAYTRYMMLEQRLNKNPELKDQYVQFICEYEKLKHCKEVNEKDDPPNHPRYYMPHHAVLRPSSTSTKCRVVFDASAKMSPKALSLNDVLQVGGTIQDDLFSIMLRFRKHKFAFTADIAKMYRQVQVDPSDTSFQRIFWRENPGDRLRVLELTTVTYGTGSAPFQAVRCVKQLAEDEAAEFPIGARIAKEDFYVDDVLSGADTLSEAEESFKQLTKMLARGGFPVHKWCSNSKELLNVIPKDSQEQDVCLEECRPNSVIKVLGIKWSPREDELLIAEPKCEISECLTKRSIYSNIAKIYDPLGLIAPVTVVAKLLVQNLWKAKVDWDQPIEDETIRNRWLQLASSLPTLNSLTIPRRVTFDEATSYEVQGFADASMIAYGANVYLRSLLPDGTAKMRLLASKSKIAPLKDITIPRKELCAALLLARLIPKILPALKMQIDKVHLRSDSQIFLAWMKRPPERLESFVRNRITKIQELTAGYEWSYVPSKENPADVVSRGQLPDDLCSNSLWWHGPEFLSLAETATYEVEDIPSDQLPEYKLVVVSAPAVSMDDFALFSRHSSFRKIQRIVAYMHRFVNNHRRNKAGTELVLSPYPTISELRQATRSIIWLAQHTELADDIRKLKSDEPCRRIGNLHPILVDDLLRVGGRIQRSNLPFATKHPIILPNHSPITKMLIRSLHEEHLHTGQAGVLAAIRQRYWLLNAKSTVRQVIRSCVQCFRTNPTTPSQLMGNLPEQRVIPSPPFAITGVDYAGPLWIKEGRRRPTLTKAYVAVFVCMATKAVHLEAVSDLSTDAFLAALDRFIGRRGMVQQIHSDCGTNFRGASSEFDRLYKLFQDKVFLKKIQLFAQPKEIEWHFIPANAPEFGGLWEAAVKCMKTHLTRIAGNAKLTFEELATILTSIEAVLNSRPLYTVLNDPEAPEVVTPSHYLIGRPLTALPEPSLEDVNAGRLSRWQHLKQMRDHFWRAWSNEYLISLQPRKKNIKQMPNIRPGMIVLLKDRNQPPLQWKRARITQVYPGPDGLVRAIDVACGNSVYRRAINKVSVLPIEDNNQHSRGYDAAPPIPGGVCSVRNSLDTPSAN
ncbi:uncharacterized protein LOC129739089 [Uranotaenia lowii]|uniref:uncharacterized protein LOC129739089 n=1 Tax=Uranotaenia lowii TaxID=190385 RepID=UPI00247843B6|nr:uncharacterized protein LOC129739089 [Uranotaenia lowii]